MAHIKEFTARGKTTSYLAWLKACTHRYLFQMTWHGGRCHIPCTRHFFLLHQSAILIPYDPEQGTSKNFVISNMNDDKNGIKVLQCY